MNKWLAALLEQILKQISPELRNALVVLIKELEKDAKATKNPWDDILVGIVKFLLAIP